MKKIAFNLTAIIIAALSSSAYAQKAGGISASVGFTKIAPSVTSGNLSTPSIPNTQSDVGDATGLTGALNYMVTDHLAVHVPLGLGFKHDVVGAGAIASAGKLADTRALPITLIGQYRFMETEAKFRPYAGAGLAYVKFYETQATSKLTALTNPGSATPTTLSFDSKMAPVIQLGGTFNINEKWYVDASYTKTFLKTRGTLSTGQTIDVKLNPDGFTFQVGYKF